jgi:outer membrane protein
LEARFRPRTTDLENLQKELQDLQAKLQKPGVSQADQQDITASGQRKQREMTRKEEDLRADVERERTDILQRAGQRMTDVVKKLADEKGLDVVVDVTTAIFFKPVLEITNEAVVAYDKTFPVK